MYLCEERNKHVCNRASIFVVSFFTPISSREFLLCKMHRATTFANNLQFSNDTYTVLQLRAISNITDRALSCAKLFVLSNVTYSTLDTL